VWWYAVICGPVIMHQDMALVLHVIYVCAGHSSKSVFHSLHAVLRTPDAHLVEVCIARQTHSFLLSAADRRRVLPRWVCPLVFTTCKTFKLFLVFLLYRFLLVITTRIESHHSVLMTDCRRDLSTLFPLDFIRVLVHEGNFYAFRHPTARVYSIAVAWYALTQRSKGQRSRSQRLRKPSWLHGC